MQLIKKLSNKKPMDIVGKISEVILYIAMFLLAVSLLIPILWMVNNALKGEVEYLTYPTYNLPIHPTISNFFNSISKLEHSVLIPGVGKKVYNFFDMLGFSLLWSFGFPAFSLLLTTMCAYVIAKYKFKGRSFIYSLSIIIMILPIIGSLPSDLQIKKALGIYDNMLMLILTGPSAAFSGVNFLLLYSSFKSVPWAYAECAFMDVVSLFIVFRSIMLPMVMPTVAVLFLLSFIGAWNDYTSFLYWMPSYSNIALGIYNFQQSSTSHGSTTPEILAGFIITSIPIIILYISSQKLISSTLNVGGLKE